MKKKHARITTLSLLFAICGCSSYPNIVFEKENNGSTNNVQNQVSTSATIPTSPVTPDASESSQNPATGPTAIVYNSASPTIGPSATPSPSQTVSATPTPTPIPTLIPTVSPESNSNNILPPEGSVLSATVKGDISDIEAWGNYIFIADKKADKVHVLDVRTKDYIIKSISVSPDPQGLDVNPSGTKLYVASKVLSKVDVIDLETLENIDSIDIESPANDVKVTDTHMFVTLSDSGWHDPPVYNLSTKAKVASLKKNDTYNDSLIYNYGIMELSSDNKYLYIGQPYSGTTIYKFSVEDPVNPQFLLESKFNSISGTLTDLLLSTDDKTLFISNYSSSYLIRTINTEEIYTENDKNYLKVGDDVYNAEYIPDFIAISSDGKYLAASNNTKSLKIFNVQTMEKVSDDYFNYVDMYELGQLAFSEDGRYLYSVMKNGDTSYVKMLKIMSSIAN